MGAFICNTDFQLSFTSGDTEYVRLNLKDSEETIISPVGSVIKMGIKRNVMDEQYIIEEKTATIVTYVEGSQEYTIELKFTSDDTIAILNYWDKQRKRADLFYDIELHETVSDDRTTILAGPLVVTKSISGAV